MRAAFDYAVVRLVPRVEREEFLNVGVILHAPTRKFLKCMLRVDPRRVTAFAGDVDLAGVEAALAGFAAVCEGTAGAVQGWSTSERFHWLVAPRSSAIQCSPVHGGVADDLDAALRELFARRVA
ncbi:MAG: DUF3037 domain-containing protein [Myxococcales bacterium]|nr:DUF3037 domain-containing protein [Myxococcales bacterium]